MTFGGRFRRVGRESLSADKDGDGGGNEIRTVNTGQSEAYLDDWARWKRPNRAQWDGHGGECAYRHRQDTCDWAVQPTARRSTWGSRARKRPLWSSIADKRRFVSCSQITAGE